MTDRPCGPEKLTKAHDRSQFSSGAEELDTWLREYAWQNQRANNATTYVTHVDQQIVGYYALTVASYARSGAPQDLVKGAPDQVPCILLARLAVDATRQGQGIGAGLLLDALRRAVKVSDAVGARVVLVHARSDEARDFYLCQGDFRQSPIDPLHLFASIRQLTTTLGYT